MRKIKILIADDNQLALQSMQTTIPWEEWGCRLVGCAGNGTEALEQIRELQPDAVILDIHMPGRNGLEVTAMLQTMEKKPLVILLSAYDKFTYAKTGFRLGVFDYLLKPLDSQELKVVLEKATTVLQREMASEKTDWIRGKCEKLLMESLNGRENALQTLEEILAEQWHACGYALVQLQKEENTSGDLEAFRLDVQELLENENVHYLSVEIKNGKLILLGFSSLRLIRDYNLKALYLTNLLVERGKKTGLHLFAGISDFSEKLTNLERMNHEAVFALQSRFFLENKSIIHYQSVMSKSVHNEYVLSKKMQELFAVINQSRQDPERLMGKLDAFIALLEEDNRYDVEYVRIIVSQIAFSVSSILDGSRADGTKLKTIAVIQDEVQQITGMQDMVHWLRSYTQRCLERLREKKPQVSRQTKRVLDYINENYMNAISLGDAAEYVGLSESHLCRLLKNDIGESFVNILNKIRIQKAEQLIDSENYKVYEVAEQVGFSNYAYFYQVFRKLTGISPTEYQKR